MALDTEIKVIVRKLMKEMQLNDEFEKVFVNYLERESEFQCDDEDRMKVIDLLRDSMKGLFLAASKYPKNRETRAPSVEEFNQAVTKETLLDACKYTEDQGKHTHLLDAPIKDIDGNPYIIRYNKVEDTHYLASEKEGKKTGNTASHNGDKWVEVSK